MAGELHTISREIAKPEDARPIYDALADDLVFGNESPFPGSFDIGNSPWIKEPLDKLFDCDDVRRVLISGAAQLSKTLAGLIFVMGCIKRRPGLTTWNGQTDDAVKKVCEDKAWPLFRRSKMIKELLPRDLNKSRIKSIVFPHMSLRFQTASENNAHSDTVKNQINDERHLWPQGMIHKFKSRVGAMRDHKILDLSTGSVKTAEQVLDDGTLLELGDDFFNDWMTGSRSIWSVRCPECGDLQPEVLTHRDANGRPLKDADGNTIYGFVWDENETTRPGGRWHMGEVLKTVRWRCRSCAHELYDTDDNIRSLNDPKNGAQYVATNPLHDPAIWSYRYPAFVSVLVGWRTIISEYLRAKESSRAGDHLALKTVVQNRLAEAWDESVTIGTESRGSGDYDADKWADDPRFADGRVFLTVDRQRKYGLHFWALARIWNESGESRLIGYWKLFSYEEVRAKQEELGVRDHRVLIDSGDEAADVYGQCCIYGWTALKGEDSEYFLHKSAKAGAPMIQRYYSKPAKGDPIFGKRHDKISGAVMQALRVRRFAKLYRWSTPSVRDILAAMISGNAQYWGRPEREPEFYREQLDSEVKKPVKDKRGRERMMWVQFKPDNHARDCEAMQVAAALMAGLLKGSTDTEPAAPEA